MKASRAVTVMVNEVPLVAKAGALSAKWVAGAASTAKGSVLLVLPSASCTEIVAAPGAAINDAGTVAVSWPAFIKLVVREMPLNLMVHAGEKFDPLTVNVKLEPPATTLLGVIEVTEIIKLVMAKVTPVAPAALAVT